MVSEDRCVYIAKRPNKPISDLRNFVGILVCIFSPFIQLAEQACNTQDEDRPCSPPQSGGRG